MKTGQTDTKTYSEECRKAGVKPLSRDQYRSAIRHGNAAVRDRILAGDAVNLPHGMGILYLYVEKRSPTYEDSKTGEIKIKASAAKDWNATRKYWKDHPEKKGKEFIYFLGSSCMERLRLMWDKFYVRASGKRLFVFVPAGSLLKKAGKRHKNKETLYFS